MRYKITYYTKDKSSFLSWKDTAHYEWCKTNSDLNLMIDIIKQDATITKAFYEDVASKNIGHIK